MTPLSILAVILAGVIAWKAPAHRSMALALFLAKVCELVRPSLPSRAAMVLLLALPALSAWSTVKALCWKRAGYLCAAAWAFGSLWVVFGPRAWAWWDLVWPVGLGAAAGVEGGAWVRWRVTGGTSGVTQRTAAALTAGDVGGFLIGVIFGWKIPWLAEAVAISTCWVQLHWLLLQWEIKVAVGRESRFVGGGVSVRMVSRPGGRRARDVGAGRDGGPPEG